MGGSVSTISQLLWGCGIKWHHHDPKGILGNDFKLYLSGVSHFEHRRFTGKCNYIIHTYKKVYIPGMLLSKVRICGRASCNGCSNRHTAVFCGKYFMLRTSVLTSTTIAVLSSAVINLGIIADSLNPSKNTWLPKLLICPYTARPATRKTRLQLKMRTQRYTLFFSKD